MFRVLDATIVTALRPNEIAARIAEHTFEADPELWWFDHNIGGSRWVGIIAGEQFKFRRPYPTEGFFHPFLSVFYNQIGFNGVVSSSNETRSVAFSAILRPPSTVGYILMFVALAALCLLCAASAIVEGDATARLVSALLALSILGVMLYIWWGFKSCAKTELHYLTDVLDASVKQKTAGKL